ncbi:cadherin repeat domain-containing protein [Aureibaculum algae]|uniref:Cadherin repeat domain-containing protein n=1 Tax=Aureibaculum algae TaxID=2584122 RepID=A0A5B7TQE8_9FLAO|nr:cadherin repeat domain-containing protein [Aureibaculum algae]QCX39169.1 cadherin repeat domain-containing protein [Aureibaculum algae]
MKKINKLVVTFVSIIAFSCASDDINPEIIASDFFQTIDENQLINTEIGKIEATSNEGKLSFTIKSQSPNGSLAIHNTNGILSVANATTFDYETNQTITASIEIKSKSLTKTIKATITLNNTDDLAFFLSDSKAAYIAAADNEWVFVTENEYNTLYNNLNSVAVHGSTDSEFDYTSEIQLGPFNGWTMANINQETAMPNHSYIFAFKYEVKGNNITNTQVKQSSTSNYSGFTDVGNTLPIHSSTTSKIFCFVIKNNNNPTTDNGYMGLYKSENSYLSFKRQPGKYYWSNSNVNDLNDDNYGSDGASGVRWLHQGLSTTQKQW